MIVATFLAVAALGCGGGPGPDQYPGSSAPVTCTDKSYDYTLPAVNADTGEPIAGLYFKCHHPKGGRDICSLARKRKHQRR